ncbi:hypothetical protein F4810DRAFT_679830 [Camillea tinctor]|nr:hypothetical protein F4810DRAFT_679830 [Camillea tinctor]
MDTKGYAFITGGGSGIGKACAMLFAELGTSGILIADLNLEAAQETASEATAVASNPNFRAETVHLDVSDEESVANAVQQMVKLFGRIDYSVHCAGIPVRSYEPVSNASFPEFQDLIRVHVHGTFLVTRAVSAAMKSQEPVPVDSSSPDRGITRGSIVNLASVTADITPANMVQYNAAKHAVQGITKTAAVENGPLGTRVNCICPTWIETSMYRQTMEVIPPLNEQTAVAPIPMGRVGTAKEVAQSAIFLCSSWSSFMTGHSLVLDGGMTIM